jgi:hypothetical protein
MSESVDYYEDDEDWCCPFCGEREDECLCEREAYNQGYDPRDDYTK